MCHTGAVAARRSHRPQRVLGEADCGHGEKGVVEERRVFVCKEVLYLSTPRVYSKSRKVPNVRKVPKVVILMG